MALFFRLVPASARDRADGALYGMEVSEEDLRKQIIEPYRAGEAVTWEGRTISSAGAQITISDVDELAGQSLDDLRAEASRGPGYRRRVGDLIARAAPNVTPDYVTRGSPAPPDPQAQPDVPSRAAEPESQGSSDTVPLWAIKAISVFVFLATAIGLFMITPIWVGSAVVGLGLASGLLHQHVLRLPPRPIALLVVLAVGVVFGAAADGIRALLDPSTSRAPVPSLTMLKSNLAQQLRPEQVPQIGDSSGVLGFGSEPGGGPRAAIPYVGRSPTMVTPVLDSFVNLPGAEDEREFLHVRGATDTGQAVVLLGDLADATVLRPAQNAWLWADVDNDADPEPDCSVLTGPSIAQNTLLRLSEWDSPDRRLHVIRAWLYANNATPRWVTDAVAVVTPNATSLQLAPRLSWQLSDAAHSRIRPLSNDAVVSSPGLTIGDHGLLGSCWSNRETVAFVFRQTG